MSIENNGAVRALAAQGVPWAVKLQKKSWASLTTAQKRAARKALGTPQKVSVQQNLRVNRVSMPIATASRISTGEPRVSVASRSMTVAFSELVGTVSSSTDLKTLSWVINPSVVSTFPQLSINAVMYEKYKFSRLAFRYAPSCPTTTGGVVVLAFDPDSSDAQPVDKGSLYNYSGSTRTSPYGPCRMEVPCDGVARFVADNDTSDPKLINFGKLIVASYGQGASDVSMLGEVFVEYTVVLQDRQPSSQLTQLVNGVLTTGGPKLALATLNGGQSPYSYTLTFQSAGTFLITIYYPAAVVSPLTSGSATIQSVLGTGTEGECQAAVILATEGGQTAYFTVGALDYSPRIYVARM